MRKKNRHPDDKRKPRPKYIQGIYKPRYPDKVLNKNDIEYRSKLEFDYMVKIEKSNNILKWGSELIWIPYYNPVKKKVCQYWTDFYLETNLHGKLIIEVKPDKEIKAIMENRRPKATKNKKTSTLAYQVAMYEINKAKWKAAHQYCKKKGWKFKIISEKDLKGGNVSFL